MAQEEDEVVLLDFWASPFCIRVKIALAEKGIDYKSKEERLHNKSQLLLKTNPIQKKTPVLIHNGKAVCDSHIILQYIDEAWNHKLPLLLPSHPLCRAHARFWTDFIDEKICMDGKLVCNWEGEVQEEKKRELVDNFKILEGELGEKPFFCGKDFGFIDLVLISSYSWFYCFEKYGNFSMVEGCPKLMAWAKRCIEKDSVSKNVPDPHKVYDWYLRLIKKMHPGGAILSVTS